MEIKTEFKNYSQRKEEMEKLRSESRNRLHFGIKFLDDSLRGIAIHDLVIIASKTGIGKSELMTQIARENISKGMQEQ